MVLFQIYDTATNYRPRCAVINNLPCPLAYQREICFLGSPQNEISVLQLNLLKAVFGLSWNMRNCRKLLEHIFLNVNTSEEPHKNTNMKYVVRFWMSPSRAKADAD